MSPVTCSDHPRHLIVRLRNWVGDVVLSIPALDVLTQAGLSLTLVAKGAWAQNLLSGTSWPVYTQPKSLVARIGQLSTLRKKLSREDPSFQNRPNTLVLPQSFSSALEARLAGLLPVAYAHEGRSLLLTHAFQMPSGGHVATAYWNLSCHLLDILGLSKAPSFASAQRSPMRLPLEQIPNLPLNLSSKALAYSLLQQHQIVSPFIVLCPFTAGKSPTSKLNKAWPAFPEFAQLLHQTLKLPLVICPGPQEVSQAKVHFPHAKCLMECGLDTYAALLQLAALVVAIDTGPAHMAAAVGAPLLSLMGPTNPAQWRPLGHQVELIVGYPIWPTPQQVLVRCQARINTLPSQTNQSPP